jgi:hypothetical protein
VDSKQVASTLYATKELVDSELLMMDGLMHAWHYERSPL